MGRLDRAVETKAGGGRSLSQHPLGFGTAGNRKVRPEKLRIEQSCTSVLFWLSGRLAVQACSRGGESEHCTILSLKDAPCLIILLNIFYSASLPSPTTFPQSLYFWA